MEINIEQIRAQRELHLVIKNLCTVAAAVVELQKSVAAIEAHLEIDNGENRS
jgi:alanine racemase